MNFDALDAHMAAMCIDLLDRAVQKLTSYDEVEVRPLDWKVQRYFDEAHACHLYGLDIASAVICRAILEAALADKFDRDGKLERECRASRDRKKSYFGELLKAAEGKLLDPERVRAAEEIRDAGDSAIHVHKFAKFGKYGRRMGDIVDNTRKVLADLYS